MIKAGNNSIGKMYLGSNPIGKAYLGSNLVFQSGSQPGPEPPEPLYIQYIRGGNGSYIDTGITPDNTTRVIVWARNFNPSSPGNTWMLGSREGITDSAFAIFLGTGTAIGAIAPQYGNTAISYIHDAWATFLGYHKYELSVDGFYVDDVLVSSVTDTSFTSSKSMYLFGLNNVGSLANGNMPIDICQVKIYKGDSLVRDYSPVNSPTVGLYDSVSNTVFNNSGSGSFTYGEFDKNAYTPLDYIGCSGSQYFDSGTYGTYADGIVTKFMPTNTTPQWTTLLGYRSSNNSCDISFGTSTAGQDNMRCYWRFGANDTSGQAFSGSSSNKLTGKAVIAVKSNSTLTLYYNNSQIGSNSKTGVSSSFRTTYPMGVGTLRTGESSFSAQCFVGRIYYVGFGAGSSLVPAKQGSKVGMYDTYNDVFYESATSTPFASPE